MRRLLPVVLLAAAALSWAGDAAVPGPVVKTPSDVDWHASGSLPPGAEYHLLYEDAKTHAVQTLVRMPKGYALPAHRHSYDEVLYVLKGKVTLAFSGRERTLSSGSYAVVPAGTTFSMKIGGFGGAEFMASFNGPFDVVPAANP